MQNLHDKPCTLPDPDIFAFDRCGIGAAHGSIKRKKFVTITHGHFCNTKLSVMRKNASQPHFIRDFPSVSAIQGEVVMLKKFVMQNLQLSDCDKLFSLHRKCWMEAEVKGLGRSMDVSEAKSSKLKWFVMHEM